MDRRIRLTFPAYGAATEVVLRDDLAPRTCAAVWDALPLFATAHHAVYSGSEGVLILPALITPPPENATADVVTGDVGFTWFAPGDAYGVERPFAEICWFYDSDGKPSMPEGPVPVSVFGRCDGDTDAFYAATRRMRREGVSGMSVERVEDGPAPTHALVHRPAHGAAFGPRVAALPGGAVGVVFTHGVDLPQAGPRCQAMWTRSEDGGRTWSAPEAFGPVGLAADDPAAPWPFPVPPADASSAARWDGGGLFLGPAFVRQMAEPGPGAVGAVPVDGGTLLVYAAWDGLRDASVPGVCGVHASLVPHP